LKWPAKGLSFREPEFRNGAFLQDLKRRGLCDSLLVATDGAPGLIRAVEECFPRSERGRCLAHRMRSLQSKVPDADWPEFRETAKAADQVPSRDVARMLRDVVVAEYEKREARPVANGMKDSLRCELWTRKC
jgi:transposase-like protein